MTNPYTLLDSVVTFLQGITALVTACGGDAANIYAYKHQWPTQTSWQAAVREQKAGMLMVHYRGTGPGRWGGIDTIQHNYVILIRDQAGTDIATIWETLFNGGFCSAADINSNVELVKDASFELTTMLAAETLIDYWSASFALVEKFPYSPNS